MRYAAGFRDQNGEQEQVAKSWTQTKPAGQDPLYAAKGPQPLGGGVAVLLGVGRALSQAEKARNATGRDLMDESTQEYLAK